ncbi:MAG TPA: DUF4139 domain-containing protein [Bryobacteraceae bacterium]|jgi:hypothetical protein
MIATTLAVAQAADLPVHEVILFKHGVGFFSRSGDLNPGEAARLDFKAGDMNDVLKSLTVEEKGGGKVAGLRYDSSEPLDKKLEQFPFSIGDHFSLSAVLDQMKGSRVELKYGNDNVAGQVISGRETVADKDHGAKEQIVILLDSGEMRVLDLSAASGIRFTDPAMQRQFSDYLRVVAQARSKEKRSVYIDSTGAGARSLVANYMIPSPVWKSSYRMMFTDAEPTIEGWAIVDNTTDEDWTNVQLALVSGRPISFISELYAPKYVQRQIANLAEDASVAPVVYESEMQSLAKASPPPPAPPPMALASRSAAGHAMAMNRRDAELREATVNRPVVVGDSNIDVANQGREIGELFEYRFSNPVTVKKGESAMLPFLQQKVNSRKILIFQESQGANPRNAAELSNSTGKTLDGGPITVYDGGVYAGEALMETLKAGDKRMISYAVDQGTRITTRLDSTRSNIQQISAIRGIVTTRYSMQENKVYTIRNIDDKAKTLIIEHPIRENCKLVEMKATETTTNAYRFEVKLAAKSETKFNVKEEYPYYESTQISNFNSDQIGEFIRGRAINDSGKRQLQVIADRKRQIAELDAQLAGIESEINDTTRDQDRMRQNISSLNSVNGQQDQVQRYARDLSNSEGRLATLRDQQRDSRKKKDVLEREVSTLLDKLAF